MKLKEVRNRMTPPIFRDRNRRRKVIWEGVYEHYRDVPTDGLGFDENVWIEQTRRMTEMLLESESFSPHVDTVFEDHAILPPTVVSLVGDAREATILDFGGGMGVSYIHLRQCLASTFTTWYHVVECPRVCQVGSVLLTANGNMDENITFHESLPESIPDLDLVYICSALQYVEDYAGLLQSLARLRPKAILLAKTSAGDVPTYVTVQVNMPGLSVPYWILNVDELVDIMASAGYALRYQSVLPREYHQNNFPERYRFRRARNLLFLQK